MSLLTITLGLTLAASQGQAAPEDPGAHPLISVPINKHIDPSWESRKRDRGGSWVQPMSEQTIHVGVLAWSVEDAQIDGKPCKLFRGETSWQGRVHVKGRPTRIAVKPTVYSFAWVDPSGRLIKTQTSYSGLNAPTQIEAVYQADSIDLTVTQGRDVRRTSLYPKIPMELFSGLFEPLIRDGLVVKESKECAMIHPITGAPYRFKVAVHGRFQAKAMEVPYEGYYVDVVGEQGTSVAAITRQGQLLKLELPDRHDAIAYTSLNAVQMREWGAFKPDDWTRPTSETHPARQRHRTLIAPVMLTNPRLVMPVPCVLAY